MTTRSFGRDFIPRVPILGVVIALGFVLAAPAFAQPFAFTKIESNLTPTNFSSLSLGDIDGDGQIDIVQSGSISDSGPYAPSVVASRNLGESVVNGLPTRLFDATELGSGLWLGPVDFIDFDGDGNLDVFVSGASAVSEPFASSIGLYLGDGLGGFSSLDLSIESLYSGSSSWGDFDGDGDADLILTGVDDSGGYRTIIYETNAGTLTPLASSLPGVAFGDSKWGDIDNDGDIDLYLSGATITGEIISDVYLNDGSGDFSAMDAGFVAPVFASADLGDYDADGDLDIAIAGGYVSPLLFSSAVTIYRNDGASFSRVADLEGGFYGSLKWGDHDNDGFLDLLSIGRLSAAGRSVTRIYHIGDDGQFVNHVNLPGYSYSSAEFADFDSDGDLDVALTGLGFNGRPASSVYRNDQLLVNEAPSAPTGLQSTVADGTVSLGWTPGVDELTPSLGLTYEVRIGSAPGLSDIRSTYSDLGTGKRYVPRQGAAGVSATHKFSLAPGTYYWSVQSIDNSFLGSEFAPEQSFVVVSQDVQTGVEPLESLESVIFDPYPNPARTGMTIPYRVRAGETGDLTIYSALGQRVQSHTFESSSGIEEYYWDGIESNGQALASGIYFVRFQTSSVSVTKTVVIVR